MSISRLVNSLKGVSARRLRYEFTGRVNRSIMHGHFWSPSYFAASCGGAPLSIIGQYLEQRQRPAQR
ncbi:transposase [Glycomyces xiaoerkulensis]|uniref:transposase n=1 Tax=Glycomyces xiaoerkulensis TaxID=2038139 RepID=UPI0038CBFC2D